MLVPHNPSKFMRPAGGVRDPELDDVHIIEVPSEEDPNAAVARPMVSGRVAAMNRRPPTPA
jgi:hypothetical protein